LLYNLFAWEEYILENTNIKIELQKIDVLSFLAYINNSAK